MTGSLPWVGPHREVQSGLFKRTALVWKFGDINAALVSQCHWAMGVIWPQDWMMAVNRARQSKSCFNARGYRHGPAVLLPAPSDHHDDDIMSRRLFTRLSRLHVRRGKLSALLQLGLGICTATGEMQLANRSST